MDRDTLLAMSQTLGEVKGLLQAVDAKIDAHVAQDDERAKRLSAIETHLAEQKGVRKAVHAFTAAIGSIVGSGVTLAVKAAIGHNP